ncbi:MAG: hypothetical protein QOJ07_2486 [Thermoleophilaceae bacterium]|nr:hypothetical protein [Thermoleophilaceae bacterium]
MTAIIEFDADHEVTVDGAAKEIMETLRDARYGPYALLQQDGDDLYVNPSLVRLVRDA